MTPIQYLNTQLEPYIGWKIKMGANDNETFGIVFESPNKQEQIVLWLKSDKEGNGAGWFKIEKIF